MFRRGNPGNISGGKASGLHSPLSAIFVDVPAEDEAE
jgi:hypothetical protein